jgi:hypothetical protein
LKRDLGCGSDHPERYSSGLVAGAPRSLRQISVLLDCGSPPAGGLDQLLSLQSTHEITERDPGVFVTLAVGSVQRGQCLL